VLILGAGGREHAMAWAFSKDKNVGKIYCAPGNGGTQDIAENIIVNLVNHQEILRIALEKDIDLTVVGPENPLADGIVDIFRKEGLRIFGPDSYGSQLESSKLFARDLMAENHIPQPLYYSCSTREEVESLKAILKLPLVLKADGLAAGKGVIICRDEQEYKQALQDIFEEQQFGKAARRISLERCLDGEELSVFAVCDGKDYIVLNSAQDHKRVFDGDKGPNTGGMGAYSPTPFSTPHLLQRVKSQIIQPTLDAMVERGHPYTGFLYVGLMIVDDYPFVIEFNVRMGDPEAQVVLPLLKSSLFELLWNATEGKLKETKVRTSSQIAVTVVLAAEGYPNKYDKGMKIKGLESVRDRLLFHAGTHRQNHDIVTSGGRVLNAVGFGIDLSSAIKDAYDIVKKIDYRGKYYRKDIGARGMQIIKKGA
jgi:phosphoribosylamine--glycine ligase